MDKAKYEAFKATLAGGGIKIVVADQLFETPTHLAERMVDMAGVDEDSRVLEPSAGTGVIVRELSKTGAEITAVEINSALAMGLANIVNNIHERDFLECGEELGTFDAVIMNPPFSNGADIKHIKHAMKFLNPGGTLVAICANGPRQKRELISLADYWEDLPAGTFKDKGTNVNTALLTITK